MNQKEKEIRAVFDDNTITVYQAYNKYIALAAVRAQTFVSPFRMERMTWIKPSFLWMMYRSGWATKENQEHVLAVKMKREGFEWLLENACLSTYKPDIHASHDAWKQQLAETSVRIQWDPEKDIHLNRQEHRSIQIGMTGIAVQKYVKEWITGIEDITNRCHEMHTMIQANDIAAASAMLPQEEVYPYIIS